MSILDRFRRKPKTPKPPKKVDVGYARVTMTMVDPDLPDRKIAFTGEITVSKLSDYRCYYTAAHKVDDWLARGRIGFLSLPGGSFLNRDAVHRIQIEIDEHLVEEPPV